MQTETEVDASSGIWTLQNASLTGGLTGLLLRVSGAANAGNNGLHLITGEPFSITGPEFLQTVTTGLVSETFGPQVVISVLEANQSDGYWSFANAGFTQSNVGDTLLVANAANPSNSGAFVITSFIDSSHVMTASTGLVTETFGPNVTVGIQPKGP